MTRRPSVFSLLSLLALALAPDPAAAAPPAVRSAARRPRIEVAFVLDATGSMGPWIRDARARIDGIAAELAGGDPAPEIRFALVAYRDRGDAFVTRVHDFTADLAVMREALHATEAGGGGATPEAVLEGLEKGIRALHWTDGDRVVKLLYLVGDAPPKRYADGPDEGSLLLEALQRRIVIHTIACGSLSGSGQTFFERMARLSEGRAIRLADAARATGHRGGGGRAAPSLTAAGATRSKSLASAVSGTARAYSGAAGVAFKDRARPVVETESLPIGSPGVSGLLGAQLRFVADATTFSDLWAAHTSARAPGDGPRPDPPPVDFARQQVLVLGGADAGLTLDRVEAGDGVRFAFVRPAPAGVRFFLVPAADPVILAPTQSEGASR